METLYIVAFVAAIILAAIDEVRARGQALTSWGLIIVAAVLLYAQLK